jgi:hypothetical protein
LNRHGGRDLYSSCREGAGGTHCCTDTAGGIYNCTDRAGGTYSCTDRKGGTYSCTDRAGGLYTVVVQTESWKLTFVHSRKESLYNNSTYLNVWFLRRAKCMFCLTIHANVHFVNKNLTPSQNPKEKEE